MVRIVEKENWGGILRISLKALQESADVQLVSTVKIGGKLMRVKMELWLALETTSKFQFTN